MWREELINVPNSAKDAQPGQLCHREKCRAGSFDKEEVKDHQPQDQAVLRSMVPELCQCGKRELKTAKNLAISKDTCLADSVLFEKLFKHNSIRIFLPDFSHELEPLVQDARVGGISKFVSLDLQDLLGLFHQHDK